MYWGNQENLDRFVEHALQFTDDITIAYIDLLDIDIKSDKANIVKVPYTILLEQGYFKVFRILEGYAANSWVFNLGVTERITYMNMDMVNKLLKPNNNYAYTCSGVGPFTGDAWHRAWDVRKATSVGRLHETPMPVSMSNGSTSANNDVLALIDKASYTYTSKEEENIVNGYRLLTRVKWLAGLSSKENQFGPSNFWWTHYNNSLASDLYEKYKYIYELNKQDMITEFSKRDDWRQFPI